jgi:hypothetical protein
LRYFSIALSPRLKGTRMNINLTGVEVGLAVNLETLREVFKKLNIKGRRWWMASDPQDAVEDGSIVVGHGHPQCTDRLNTLTFRVPVLNDVIPEGGTNKIVVLLDPAVVSPEDVGYYVENGRIMQDSLEDFTAFYLPIKRALLSRLQIED